MTGHVKRRGPGRWIARYRGPDGKEHSKTWPTKKDAQQWLADQLSSLRDGTWTDPKRGQATIGELAQEWLAIRVDLRSTSRERLRGVLDKYVVPEFGARRVSSIRSEDIQAWIMRLSAAGMAPATVRKVSQGLSGLLAWCVFPGRRITVNPAIGVRMPERQSKPLRFPETEEVAALAEAVPDRYRVLILTAAYAGLRWGELAGLRRSKVDALRARLTVDWTAVDMAGQPVTFGAPKTAGSRRVVPAYSWLIAELQAHMDTYTAPEPDALVFTNASGQPLRRAPFRSVWNPALRATGLDGLKPHDLRHHAVSLWIELGFSIKQVSVWAGHASIAITGDTYAHQFAAREEDVTARLDARLPEMPTAPMTPRAVPIRAKSA